MLHEFAILSGVIDTTRMCVCACVRACGAASSVLATLKQANDTVNEIHTTYVDCWSSISTSCIVCR